jgi:hypothetical protein
MKTDPPHSAIDYVRVWQSDEFGKMGCDPPERPTAKYIEDHLDVYSKYVLP